MSHPALRTTLTLGVLCVAVLAGCADGDGHTGSPSSAPGSTVSSPLCDDPPCYGDPENVGTLESDVVAEISGMAASVRTPGVYYAVSDEAGTSQVVLVHEDGGLVGRLTIDGMNAANAEAMTVGACGDEGSRTCFYVGDIGDHVGRADVVVHRVPEPDLTEQMPDTLDSEELRYTYADGPVDAEALMVDEVGRPLIISKTEPARLYRGSPAGGELEVRAEFDLPTSAGGVLAELTGNVVTGASAKDGVVLVRTYDEVLEYRAPGSAADPADFPTWKSSLVPAPPQIQSETVTHRVDGCGYVTTSELTGDIHAVPCLGGDE